MPETSQTTHAVMCVSKTTMFIFILNSSKNLDFSPSVEVELVDSEITKLSRVINSPITLKCELLEVCNVSNEH